MATWATLPKPQGPHRMVKVFDHDQLMRIAGEKDSITGNSGDRRHIEITLAHLLQRDEVRPLALPGAAYEAQLEELSMAFPAFKRAISEVAAPWVSLCRQ